MVLTTYGRSSGFCVDPIEKTHRLVVFGQETGQQEHYEHFDLLLGKRATAEVFPEITHWLLQHDAAGNEP
jgi:hypothetical protein